jgi:hypothetical protein
VADAIFHCDSCASSNLIELSGEVCLHFPGITGLKKKPFFVFPRFLVCLDCGFLRSQLSAEDLAQVRKVIASVEGASA